MKKVPAANAATATPSRKPGNGRVFWLGLLLAGITCALYFPTAHHDFVNIDDPNYVTENPRVQAGLTAAGVRWAFSTWHPLTWLSLMLDVNLFGAGPRGFHLMNLGLHAANVALVFLVLRKVTGTLWRSLIVAALFGWHPVQVETVAWVAERKGLLSTFFGLLTLLAYAAYAAKSEVQGPKPKVAYALALLGFTLGLMSKPMLVTLPGVMLLLDFWPLQRFTIADLRSQLGRLLREKIPFFALSILSAGATVWFQKSAGALQTLDGYSAASRLENFSVGYAHYLSKAVWPVNLVTPYPRVFHWPAEIVVLAAVVTVGFCVGALWLARKHPHVFTGWFWFLGMLVPVNGLIQVGAQSVADRYAYLPLIGWFILLVWSAGKVVQHWKVPRGVIVFAALVVLTASAARTRDQLKHWQDSETLCRHAIAASKENWIAYYCLGWHYDLKGRPAEAFQNYQRATEIKPNYAEPWNGMGCLLTDRNDFTNAVNCFAAAVQARPDRTEFRYNYARALSLTARSEEAMEQYRQVIQQKPDNAAAHSDLGTLLARQGKFNEAISELQAALRWDANNPLTHYFLGKTFGATGRKTEAIEHFQAALRLQPDFAGARNELRKLETTP